MKKAITFILVMLLIGAGNQLMAQKKASDFTLEKLSGGNFTLSDYSGKVVLIFNFGSSCGNCKAAAPTVNSTLIQYFKSNPNFIAIGIDDWNGSQSAVTTFKNVTGLDIPLLLNGRDVVSNMGSDYDQLVVIDAQGYIVFQETQKGAGGQAVRAKSVIQSALDALATDLDEIDTNAVSLEQNYPNPFDEETNIRFNLKASSFVTLDVYDLGGRHVSNIANGVFARGENKVEFERNGIPGGVYFYRLNIAGDVHIRKMIVR